MSATESPAELVERLRRERDQAPVVKRNFPVAITGGRTYQPSREELAALLSLLDRLQVTELHHGDSRGVDRDVAAFVLQERPEIRIVPHPANWRPEGPFGEVDYSAGPVRNARMMTACRALIAFPGGRGTRTCRESARKQGKPIYSIEEEVDNRRIALERELLAP